MKVQATSTMAKELNKFFKSSGIQIEAVYQTMTAAAYGWNVDIYAEQHENDFLPVSGKMRAIKILYPFNYYACPRYLTSNDLIRAYRQSDKTFSGFMQSVYNEIAI